MKLTARNRKGLVKVNEELLCPKVVTDSGIQDFFKTDNKNLYKFSTLCHAQLTTQALLRKMMQELNLTDDDDDDDDDWEEESAEESNFENDPYEYNAYDDISPF